MDAGKNYEDGVKNDEDESEHHLKLSKEDAEKTQSLFDFSKNKTHSLSEDEIISHSFLFFTAGYETTASLLTFSSYSLAINPMIQQTLYEEIHHAVESNPGQGLTYDIVSNLPFLDAIICETLRMYPPLVQLERSAENDYHIPELNLTLPKGSTVIVPLYVLHRNPKFHPNPEKFDPQRFMKPQKSEMTPYSYLPFGAGPRNCLAMRFGLLEAKLVLSETLLKFKFTPVSRTPQVLEYSPGPPLLNTKKPIILGVEPRV
jgi:cytochrome P450